MTRPTTPDTLHAYVADTLGFTIPRTSRISGHAAPFDYLCHTFFEDREPRDAVVWASRGGGKTQLGAIATLLDLVFKPRITVHILGGSLEQSSRMYAHLLRLVESDDVRDLVAHRRRDRLELTNGSVARVLAQSERAVRGIRVHRLRCDELDLFDPDIWSAAQMVTRSGQCGDVNVNAGIEALSTLHIPGGLMDERIHAPASTRRLFKWNVIDVLEQCPPERDCNRCPLHSDCRGLAKSGSGFIRIDDAIRQQQRTHHAVWKTEMLCVRPEQAGGRISGFTASTHVDPSCADTPFSHDEQAFIVLGDAPEGPGVALLGVAGREQQLRVIDEVIDDSGSPARLAELAQHRDWTRSAQVVPVEHAGRDAWRDPVVTCWRTAGWNINQRRSPDTRARLLAIEQSLGRPDGLRIHPRCRRLIQALAIRERRLAHLTTGPRGRQAEHDRCIDALGTLVVAATRESRPTRRRLY